MKEIATNELRTAIYHSKICYSTQVYDMKTSLYCMRIQVHYFFFCSFVGRLAGD